MVDGGHDVGAVLLAWVPDANVPAVDAGIDVNMVGCVYWLEDRHRTVDAESLDAFEGVIDDPIPFSPPRMPQRSWWLPLLIGVPFVVLNFAAQSLFRSEASKWLASGGIVLAGIGVLAWNAVRVRRSSRR